MDVACSTLCFTREPFERALRHIAELEFSKVDLGIFDGSPHLTPEEVVEDVAAVVHRIRQGPTMSVSGITARLSATGADLEQQLDAIGHLAKQLTVPVVTIEAAPTGTAIEDECRRLSTLAQVLSLHGVILTIVTKTGTLTEEPATAVQLCELVDGLGLTLDPSHYICGPWQGKSFDTVYPHVKNVHLRDTGPRMDQLQIKVGRGEVEYGRIVTSLGRVKYTGTLTIAIEDALASEDMDIEVEVRKLGLFLESLL